MADKSVVIDTNILYSLVGLSTNSKVESSNIEDYDICVTTASLVEVIVHYKDDLESIKRCLTPIISGQYRLLSIGHTPLSQNIINNIHNSNQINEIRSLIDNITDFKITKESEVLRFMLFVVTMGNIEALKKHGYSFDNDSDKFHELIVSIRAMYKGNLNYYQQYLTDQIKRGYNEGKAQKAALNAFETLLTASMNTFLINYHTINNNQTLTKVASESSNHQINIDLRNDVFWKKFNNSEDNPIFLFSNRRYKEILDEYTKLLEAEISGQKNITDESTDYLITKLKAFYKENTKFKKNDSFDYFISLCLGLENVLLVTLDRKFLKILKKIDQESYDLCANLGFV